MAVIEGGVVLGKEGGGLRSGDVALRFLMIEVRGLRGRGISEGPLEGGGFDLVAVDAREQVMAAGRNEVALCLVLLMLPFRFLGIRGPFVKRVFLVWF